MFAVYLQINSMDMKSDLFKKKFFILGFHYIILKTWKMKIRIKKNCELLWYLKN